MKSLGETLRGAEEASNTGRSAMKLSGKRTELGQYSE